VHERYVEIGGVMHFLRHSELRAGRRSLVFVHGLGESGLSFVEAFEHLHGLDCNLIVPDCAGYGRSAGAAQGDYAFVTQVARLRMLAAGLGLDRLVLVGHSLGGMLATLWAGEAESGVEGVVNIEGNLSPEDATFSRLGVEAFEEFGGDWTRWREWYLGKFLEEHVLAAHGDTSSGRRYYASLCFSRPEAFLANAREILERTQIVPGAAESAMAGAYAALPMPTCYCWGTETLSGATQRLLSQHGLAQQAFKGVGHWPMVDDPHAFYAWLHAFACQ